MNITPRERDCIFRTDFLSFARGAFAVVESERALEECWHHEAIAKVLVESEGKKTRKFINGPPRSLKSFMVSVAWVAYKLGHDPTHKFICASYSIDLAGTFGEQCRRLMLSPWYCRLFPTRLSKATNDELVTTNGGFRLATSIGSTLTGLGGDSLIVDDPLNAAEVYSEASRNNVITWFPTAFMSRLNDKRAGVILVVAQRLHPEDLPGFLIERGWDGLVLPAIAPRDMRIPLLVGNHFWKAGEPLQEREPISVIEDQKRQMSGADFSAQYLQDPVPEAGNMLKLEWLKWYDLAPIRQPRDEVVQSWDTAVKVTATSSYSVCLTFLVRNNNEYYLLNIWRKRVEFPDLVEAVRSQAAKYNPTAILIEEQASGAPLIAECKRKGMTGIIGRRPVADKVTRLNGETALLQGGSLIVPKSAPYLDDWLLEYRGFPHVKHDDQIDALSQFLNWRTEAEARVTFSFEFWNDSTNFTGTARLAAPSPEEMLWILGR
jgi:predicted phage terminase large subunit-like protein